MKEHTIYIYSAILALVVSAVFGFGLNSRSRDFHTTVEKALKTSVNYDQSFISMVDRLEKELATRASFGYEGGKDPMTGLVRQVVARPAVAANPVPVKKSATAAADNAVADTLPLDPIRLTAIIYDNESRIYNAVVMDNERSFSVAVGDKVGGRRIKSISEEAIIMDGDSLIYRYDISGRKTVQKK
jgi:hypothetical protein